MPVSQDLTSFSVQALHDRAIITCEYSMANFSSTEPKKKSKGDRRATEISMVIRQTFETVLMTQLFPRSQIDIFVQIIQADGGSLRRALCRAHAHFAQALGVLQSTQRAWRRSTLVSR